MKRISLIVPVWNGEKYVLPLAESVLNQGWDNLQLIFSDNGSDDRTPELLEQLRLRDDRVVVIHSPHDGVSAGRNRAMQIADGDYIGFSDADDILAPGYFCALAGLLEEYDADCACCGFDRIYERTGTADRMPPRQTEITVTDRDGFFSQLLRPDGYTTVVWNKLFRREALTDSEGNLIQFDETLHIVEDGEFIFRSRVQRAVFTPQPLYQYTVRTSGAMYGAVSPKKLTELDARRRVAEYAADSCEEVHLLAKMKYQKGVRDLLFHAMIGGSRDLVRPLFPEMRRWCRELYTSPFLSRKEKLKYFLYRPMILLNLRRVGGFLMNRLSGH